MAGDVSRLERLHPRARKKISKNPVYVSARNQEFKIATNSAGYYYIYPYKGGLKSRQIEGLFTSFKRAEDTLISYLRSTNRHGKAIWPER